MSHTTPSSVTAGLTLRERRRHRVAAARTSTTGADQQEQNNGRRPNPLLASHHPPLYMDVTSRKLAVSVHEYEAACLF